MTATAKQIKDRAKAIFAAQYNYPAVSLKSIGRPCFGWAMRKARAEAQAAPVVAIPAAEKAERIAGLLVALERVEYVENYRQLEARRAPLLAELAALKAA